MLGDTANKNAFQYNTYFSLVAHISKLALRRGGGGGAPGDALGVCVFQHAMGQTHPPP